MTATVDGVGTMTLGFHAGDEGLHEGVMAFGAAGGHEQRRAQGGIAQLGNLDLAPVLARMTQPGIPPHRAGA